MVLNYDEIVVLNSLMSSCGRAFLIFAMDFRNYIVYNWKETCCLHVLLQGLGQRGEVLIQTKEE